MGISPELLRILRCPRCRSPLEPAADGGSLVCGACALAYPVRDGFAVLILEEASPVAVGAAAGTRRP